MNSAEFQGINQVPYLNQNNNYFQRRSRKDQPWRRLATVNKIAQRVGYNLPNYLEKRTIAELLKLHGEYSYLTGKHLGKYYLSTLDLDLRNEKFAKELITYLEKSVKKLLDYLQTSYDKTKRGLHIDILTPEILENGNIYWVDKLGKKWTIGSIQSKGKYVVGEDSNKFFIENGKWYWKVKSIKELRTILSKFFFILSGNQEKPKETKQLENLKTIRYQAWDFNLNKQVEREYSLTIEQPLKKPKEQPPILLKKHNLQAKLLSIEKVLKLEHIWKVFYLDMKTNQKRYFLVNGYQRNLNSLNVGNLVNMVLIQGRNHAFFSCLV